MKPDAKTYPPTRTELEVITTIRKIDYGEVVVRIQAGEIVVIDEKRTTKIKKG